MSTLLLISLRDWANQPSISVDMGIPKPVSIRMRSLRLLHTLVIDTPPNFFTVWSISDWQRSVGRWQTARPGWIFLVARRTSVELRELHRSLAASANRRRPVLGQQSEFGWRASERMRNSTRRYLMTPGRAPCWQCTGHFEPILFLELWPVNRGGHASTLSCFFFDKTSTRIHPFIYL